MEDMISRVMRKAGRPLTMCEIRLLTHVNRPDYILKVLGRMERRGQLRKVGKRMVSFWDFR